MHAAGLIAQAAVKQRLIDGPFTPLKPGTTYNRQHRKDPPPNKRTAPLIDTRALFNAVNYAVKRLAEPCRPTARGGFQSSTNCTGIHGCKTLLEAACYDCNPVNLAAFGL